jgi:site-specific DNA-cytosine methylase
VSTRALDLFSGIGGWSLGLHRHGIITVAACESDAWKRAHYARHFPDVRLYPDVCALTAEVLDRDGLLPIDIIVGSPPCTDISTANTAGLGVDGPESRLYFEAVRLVREVRPRWCAFENSANLRARGSDWVLAEMEAAGYAVWPLVVGAVHAGAPHRRLRSWLVGCRADLVAGTAGADAAEVGRGTGRTGRLDPGPARQQIELVAQTARSNANGIGRRAGSQQGLAHRIEPAGSGGGVPDPHADAPGLRLESWRRRRPHGADATVAEIASADTDSEGQHGLAGNVEMASRRCDAGYACTNRSGGGGVTMPTPTARDSRSGKCSPATMQDRSRPLNEVLVSAGATDPVLLLAVYELLMGFPPGWLTPQPGPSASPSRPSSTEPAAPTATPSPSPSWRP